MSAIATVTQPYIDSTQNLFIVYGTIALTGDYGSGSSHGDTLDLSQLGVPSDQLPLSVDIYEQSPAGGVPSGNIFRYMFGTTQANGSLSVFTAAGSEFSEGTDYGTPPFSITGFQLGFRATFPSFL